MKKTYKAPLCRAVNLQFESALMGASKIPVGNPPGGSSDGYGEAEQWSEKKGWSSDNWSE